MKKRSASARSRDRVAEDELNRWGPAAPLAERQPQKKVVGQTGSAGIGREGSPSTRLREQRAARVHRAATLLETRCRRHGRGFGLQQASCHRWPWNNTRSGASVAWLCGDRGPSFAIDAG